ncbi:MAG: GTP-binding protein [Clostridia bacterium]
MKNSGKSIEIFAGLNTVDGYSSLLEYELKNSKKVIILKGSPGSGKSTILKRLLSYAEAKGEKTDIVRCSSDMDSFDALIFNNAGVAIADGTFPHVLEPKTVAVRERIENLGETFDYKKIFAKSAELKAFYDLKEQYYKMAYSLISAYGGIENALYALSEKYIDKEKINNFCESFIKKNLKKGSGITKILPTESFCRYGFVSTGCFNDSKTTYCINDSFGIGEEIMTAMYAKCVLKEIEVFAAPSPCDCKKVCALYFPDSDVYIKIDKYMPFKAQKNVRAVRFLTNPDGIKFVKQRKKFYDKIASSLIKEAASCMNNACIVHAELENIYSQAIDFELTDKITAKLKKEIFE